MMARLAIACLALLLSGPACAGLLGRTTGQSAYPVTDSGYWVRNPSNIYWIDNNRIIFVGASNDERDAHIAAINSDKPHVEKVYIWDTRGNAISTYAPISRYGGVCFSRGHINFVTEATEKEIVWREGTFGHEVEKRASRNHFFPDKVKERRMRTSKLNCREYPMDSYPPRTDVMLLEGHGYLGWWIGPNKAWKEEKEAPVRYYKDGASPPIELPLKRDDIRGANDLVPPSYAEWANVYLLLGGSTWHTKNEHGQRSKDQPYPVYLLTPGTGAVQTTKLPYASWLSGSFGYEYTRKGLVLWSHATSNAGLGNAGLYLADPENGYKKIIAAYPRAMTVSPDGCRIAAVLHTKATGVGGPGPLKLIDLCQGGK